MRHADAVDGPVDTARPLSTQGRTQAARMGEWLRSLGIEAPLIVSSPLVRARETATLVAETLGAAAPETEATLSCGMRPDEGAALVYALGGRAGGGLMLVGHAPDAGMLVSYLLGAEEPCVEMRKGAVAGLSLERSGFGGAVLCWLINPYLQTL